MYFKSVDLGRVSSAVGSDDFVIDFKYVRFKKRLIHNAADLWSLSAGVQHFQLCRKFAAAEIRHKILFNL
jgi:hypothetical protein